MTRFGLTLAEIKSAVSAITPSDVDDHDAEARFARAAWTGITEPGDFTAGALLAAIGADTALDGVLDGWSAARFAAAAADTGTDIHTDDLTAALERWKSRASLTAVTTALRRASQCGAVLLTPADPMWLTGLADLGDGAPTALWVRGNLRHLPSLTNSLGGVGARASTGYGDAVVMEAISRLVSLGYAINSGAAFGIDGMCHRTALASRGVTAAFLAGGVDRFYPAGHHDLLNRIVDSGLVISELPCGASPTKHRFVQRNRLIAAASRAVILFEAGWRSGALNTIRYATALGRPVGVVPGPVTSAASAGCHRLLREGLAQCVTNAEEMAALAPLAAPIAA